MTILTINTMERKLQQESTSRLAVINYNVCKPSKCNLECKNICPVNKSGKTCIEVEKKYKHAEISETLCIGCNACVGKAKHGCPFNAITIINIPKELNNYIVHRYGKNGFKLHRLPMPKLGACLGIIGNNGIGKSTILKILANKLIPNLGKNNDDKKSIMKYFSGTELQLYFDKLFKKDFQTVIKPQNIDLIPKILKGKVHDILKSKDVNNNLDLLISSYGLENILERDIESLSGGELQRFTITYTSLFDCKVYIFDEPTSYLDIKQRVKMAENIRDLIRENNYVLCVDHDLSILDYISDYICCIYGTPGAYGVVTTQFNVNDGINMFLDGYIPNENIRIRNYPIDFISKEEQIDDKEINKTYNYPKLEKTLTDSGSEFKLTIEAGSFTNSEIVVILGENGTGKTTFIRMITGIIKPDNDVELPQLNVSFKPQIINPVFKGTVTELFNAKIPHAFNDAYFKSEVVEPLQLDVIMDRELQLLSGGELQRVAIVLALSKPADVYLIDEPSAYLDVEQRFIVSKVIKKFIMNSKKSAFIVEHDFIMSMFLADHVIVFDGIPSKCGHGNKPQAPSIGINNFLKSLDITFRKDITLSRPRINKKNSIKDKEQKYSGIYYDV